MAGAPRLYADERGVWREDQSGIGWDEIDAVSGYRLGGVTAVYTVVELQFVYGEWVELQADWPGFAGVAEAITARLPGMPAGWLADVERLRPEDKPVIVWRRT